MRNEPSSPQNPAPGAPNTYDPASSIRFDEPRQLPWGLIAGLVGGFVALCAVAFVLLYKVNVSGPPEPKIPTNRIGMPEPKPGISLNGSAGGGKKVLEPGATIPGTVIDSDGETAVTDRSRCTYLKVHLQNLEQMAREANSNETQWIAAKQADTRDRLSRLGC